MLENAVAAAVAMFGKKEERLLVANIDVEIFMGRQRPTNSLARR